jgi:hypothetical protein
MVYRFYLKYRDPRIEYECNLLTPFDGVDAMMENIAGQGRKQFGFILENVFAMEMDELEGTFFSHYVDNVTENISNIKEYVHFLVQHNEKIKQKKGSSFEYEIKVLITNSDIILYSFYK